MDDLRATLCILDPRLLLDEKSASNENFRDQLAAADIIVANKSDRATPESEQALQRWWQQNGGDRQINSQRAWGKLTVIFWICRVAI